MAKNGALPAREDIPDQYKWRLEDIYPSDEKWEEDFRKVESMLGRIGEYRGRLGESANTLLEALRLQDSLRETMEKVFTYARMRRDEDNAKSQYQAMSDRSEGLGTRAGAALSFMVPEILSLSAQTLEDFKKENQDLSLYSFALEEILRQKPHTLTPEEEQILARAGEVTAAPANIFRMLNNADLTFPAITDENGNEIEVTHGRYGQLMENNSREVRREAFKSMYSAYGKLRNTMAATLNSSVKKDVFYAGVRKFGSALEASLFDDDVTTGVYDNLIKTVRLNLGSLHRYMAVRKRLLGVDNLRVYDLYVPLFKEVKWEVPYAGAVEMVKAGLAPLGGEYNRTAAAGLGAGWVDVYENRGKTSGAYSWGPYGVHPYILLNYQDNLNNAFTLAHELGHAMHSYYSHHQQPYVYAHYTIFTAEVASTVNESLLMNHLLNTVTDRSKKLFLLNHYLEQFRGTVFRQTMFAEFEKIVHAKAEAGEALTSASLCAAYRKLNEDYYGAGVVLDEEIDLEWARIPHFYSAFYVYKYATGFSAATALTGQIIREGGPAVDRYLGFLKKGGSDYPLNILKDAGVDMADPRPVQEGLNLFAQLLDQLEEQL